MKSVLVVDDEKNYLLVLSALLSEEGYEVLTCDDPDRAIGIIEEESPSLLITDMKMHGMSGMDLLKAVKSCRPQMPVIVMTAYATVETAVEAMRLGAYHYILKPFQNDEIKLVVGQALEVSELMEEKKRLKQELSSRLGYKGLVVESDAMKSVLQLIEQVSFAKTTVLIEGESGTGKELVARAIHDRSDRSNNPFIAVNCGALTETLLESELFGHEKGAFTGAAAQKKGRFELADGGTLFLDEIAATSPALQIRLLRVLQEQSFERVGGTKTIKVDVRIIAASNINLKGLIGKKEFREDLYYRLNVFTINLPPLRDRPDDIWPLSRHYLSIYSTEMAKKIQGISREALNCLKTYSWPGNIRELKNAIERAVVVCKGVEIAPLDLPVELRDHDSGRLLADAGLAADFSEPLPAVMDAIEKGIIKKTLEKSGGGKAKAARLLGISPTSLQYKLGKHGLN